jgi:hypothetical protein
MSSGSVHLSSLYYFWQEIINKDLRQQFAPPFLEIPIIGLELTILTDFHN